MQYHSVSQYWQMCTMDDNGINGILEDLSARWVASLRRCVAGGGRWRGCASAARASPSRASRPFAAEELPNLFCTKSCDSKREMHRNASRCIEMWQFDAKWCEVRLAGQGLNHSNRKCKKCWANSTKWQNQRDVWLLGHQLPGRMPSHVRLHLVTVPKTIHVNNTWYTWYTIYM